MFFECLVRCCGAALVKMVINGAPTCRNKNPICESEAFLCLLVTKYRFAIDNPHMPYERYKKYFLKCKRNTAGKHILV